MANLNILLEPKTNQSLPVGFQFDIYFHDYSVTKNPVTDNFSLNFNGSWYPGKEGLKKSFESAVLVYNSSQPTWAIIKINYSYNTATFRNELSGTVTMSNTNQGISEKLTFGAPALTGSIILK